MTNREPHSPWNIAAVVAAVVVGGLLLYGVGRALSGADESSDADIGGERGGSPSLAGRGTDVPDPLPEDLRGLGVPPDLDPNDPDAVLNLVLKSLETEPVNWQRIARLVARLPGPIENPLRARLLEEVRRGNLAVRAVFDGLQDATLVHDLLEMLAGGDYVDDNARELLLEALARLPNTDASFLVRELEVHLAGDIARDRDVLRAISKRGGPEAARAVLEYVQRSLDPRGLAGVLRQALQSARDAETVARVKDALSRPHAPDTLRVLVESVGLTGAEEFVHTLAVLDGKEHRADVRRAIISSLGEIGTKSAVVHLLGVAEAADDHGGDARRAVQRLSEGSDDVRAELVETYREAGKDPQTSARRAVILDALATMRHPPAVRLMGDALLEGDPELHRAALRGLQRMGPEARPHVKRIRALWANASEGLRALIVATLAAAGGDEAASVLESLRDDPQVPDRLRVLATQGLAKLRREAGVGGR